MNFLINFFNLLRIDQYYKNTMIFLPIIFNGSLGNIDALVYTIIGFISLCLMSSAGYIFNDIIDIKVDKLNPRKKPLANGEIDLFMGVLLMILIFLSGYLLAGMINQMFSFFVLGLFLVSASYSLLFKRIAFADIIIIAIGFVLRAVSGSYIFVKGIYPYIVPSSWLFLCVFLLAIFLVVSKRTAEVRMLGNNKKKFKEILGFYDKEITNAMMIISTSCLVICYSLYSFMSVNMLILSLPFALFIIMRYFYLVYSGSQIPLNLGKFYKDLHITIGGIIMIIVVLLLIYL